MLATLLYPTDYVDLQVHHINQLTTKVKPLTLNDGAACLVE